MVAFNYSITNHLNNMLIEFFLKKRLLLFKFIYIGVISKKKHFFHKKKTLFYNELFNKAFFYLNV